MSYTYRTRGTCATEINFDIEDGKLYNKDKTKLLYDPADKYWLDDDEE